MLRLLLDTNALLDAYIPDRPESREALAVLEAAANGGTEAYVGAGSLKDVYYIVRKHVSDDVAREYVRSIMALCTVAPLDASLCANALASSEPDFEDGIVSVTADLVGADAIVTRDEGAFRDTAVAKASPAECLPMIAERR